MSNHNANFITKKADTENVVYIIGLEGYEYWSPVSSSSVPGQTSLYRDRPSWYPYCMAKFSRAFEAASSQATGKMSRQASIFPVLPLN